jgi:hypothetical protein
MLRISGASDDLVEIEGDHRDEISSTKPVLFVIGNDKPTQGENSAGVHLRMEYGEMPGATWAATISPIDEDVPIPWSVSVASERYTAVVAIDCPKGTPIRAFIDDRLVWANGESVESEDDR